MRRLARTAPLSSVRLISRRWLDGLIPYALQTGDVAGAVVVVVKDGQVLLQKGYGYADVAANDAGRSAAHVVSRRLRRQARD